MILAIRMRLVQTITEASPVTVTQVSWEMELCVHVSVSAYVNAVYESISTDETCFVPLDRVYECGRNVLSEAECEASGCCYNSSADVQCYYTSGEIQVSQILWFVDMLKQINFYNCFLNLQMSMNVI